jgi:DNA uptake protein ComE-like DNA-binding protein
MKTWLGVRGGLMAAAILIGCVASGPVARPIVAQTAGSVQTGQAPPQTIAEKIAASKDLLDINTATPAQLKALPGMGDAYAQRVIAGRPYTAKNQLVQRGILPATEYAQIKPLIIAHRVK